MTHDERVHHHMYETCEGIAEHAERIVKLEELCVDFGFWLNELLLGSHEIPFSAYEDMYGRLRELGLDPDAGRQNG